MKEKLKRWMMMVFAMALLFAPIMSVHATTPGDSEPTDEETEEQLTEEAQVKNEEELIKALDNEKVNKIVLLDNISVTVPLYVTRELTIDGGGFKIDGTNIVSRPEDSGNASIITAQPTGELSLTNITLTNAPKYGVHAYNGGAVLLNGVTIQDCKFGAVLVNGGALIVQDLTMIKNGNFEDGKTGNGIELGKGTYVTENPYLVMDGTFTTQDQDTAIWIAENDQLMADESSKLMFGNTENSEYKLEIEGNALVVKNSDGTTVTSSNAVLEQIATDETGNETTTPEDPTDTEPEETPQQPAEENPSTSDNIMLFVSLAVISLGLSLVTFRKLCK